MVGLAVLNDYLDLNGICRNEFDCYVDGWRLMSESCEVGSDPESYDVAIWAENCIAEVGIARRDVNLYRNKSGKPEKCELIYEDVRSRWPSNTPLTTLKNRLEMKTVSDYITSTCYGGVVPERLADCTFFQPWGVAPDGRMNPRTKKAIDTTLKFIDGLARYFPEQKRKLIVMPADYYAVDINEWDGEIVDNFIGELRGYLDSVTADVQTVIEVIPYSKIISDNAERYRQIKNKVTIGDIDSCKRLSAKRWAGGNSEEAAKWYVVERLTEGILIDEIWNPVKISLGSSERDDCDGPLLSLYLKKAPRFPWIPSQWDD